MIQPEPEDLPKDNPKLEIAVLRKIRERGSGPPKMARGEGKASKKSKDPGAVRRASKVEWKGRWERLRMRRSGGRRGGVKWTKGNVSLSKRNGRSPMSPEGDTGTWEFSWPWAMIKIDANMGLVDILVMKVPNLNDNGYIQETIDIKYEWRPPKPVSRPKDSVTSSKKGSGERNGDHSFNKDNVTMVKTINMFSVLSSMDKGENVCKEPNLNVNYPFIDDDSKEDKVYNDTMKCMTSNLKVYKASTNGIGVGNSSMY
ncbi:hypothetical protein Tco_1230953 [Tanacetum coccineum]